MNRIDKAVHDLNGVLPDLVHPPEYALNIDVGCYFLALPYVYFVGIAGGRAICTPCEFEKRARELGYINGYRWGVEYPTNGKKPNVPDDVVVEMRRKNGSWHEDGEDELNQFHHRSFSAFKITDERYKPADTSYLNDCPAEHIVHTKTTDTTIEFESVKADGEFALDVLKQDATDWYDYENQKAMRLPPVGTKCIYFHDGLSAGHEVDVLEISTDEKFAVVSLSGIEVNKITFYASARQLVPLDYATRKAEAERKRVVDAAYNAIAKPMGIGVDEALSKLYDLGYLRMPPEKN